MDKKTHVYVNDGNRNILIPLAWKEKFIAKGYVEKKDIGKRVKNG